MPNTRGKAKQKQAEVREQKKQKAAAARAERIAKKQKAAAARAEQRKAKKASSSSSPLGSNSSSNSQNTTPPCSIPEAEPINYVEKQLKALSGISDLEHSMYNEEKNHYGEHVSDYFRENPSLLKYWVENLAEHDSKFKTYANQDPKLVLDIIDFNTVKTNLLPTDDHVYYSLRVLLDKASLWNQVEQGVEEGNSTSSEESSYESADEAAGDNEDGADKAVVIKPNMPSDTPHLTNSDFTFSEVIRIHIPFQYGMMKASLLSKIVPFEAVLTYRRFQRGQGYRDLADWAGRALRPHISNVVIPEMLRLGDIEDARHAADLEQGVLVEFFRDTDKYPNPADIPDCKQEDEFEDEYQFLNEQASELGFEEFDAFENRHFYILPYHGVPRVHEEIALTNLKDIADEAVNHRNVYATVRRMKYPGPGLKLPEDEEDE